MWGVTVGAQQRRVSEGGVGGAKTKRSAEWMHHGPMLTSRDALLFVRPHKRRCQDVPEGENYHVTSVRTRTGQT